MNIETENEKIQDSMREVAKNLLKEKQVDVILGYTKGSLPLSAAPIMIRREEDVNKLIWNNLCYVNLANYLVPLKPQLVDSEKGPLKIGVVSKGCVGRALIHLAVEKQINLENIKLIGIPCNGIINRGRVEREVGDKEILEISVSGENIIVKGRDFEESFAYEEYMNEVCKMCKVKSPPDVSEACIGECQEITSVEDDFGDLAEFDSKSPDEKWAHITSLLESCTLCYACREACPMCYCNLCFVDQNKPIWFGKTTEISDIIVFHLIRSMHMAGRCVACGACSSVCPMGIDLTFIIRSLEKIAKERYDFKSGMDLETLPPMMTFDMEDGQEFMLEED